MAKVFCIDCGGEVIAGQALEEMKVTEYTADGPRTFVERRCRDCAERFAADFWPEEYGPHGFQQHRPGRA